MYYYISDLFFICLSKILNMLQVIKSYLNKALAVIFILLIASVVILYQRNKSLARDLSTSKSNEKAFIVENTELKDKNITFQFTVDQLKFLNDSLTIKMNEVKKELNIKDKNLKQLQYLLSESQKRDTVVFRDTLFKDPILKIDTIMGDKWYQLKLGLRYPNKIIVEPKFINEKYIIMEHRRETINPPKKFFLLRWFQKRHTIVEVEVVDKNPYSENKQQRFIEIIK